MWHEQNSISYLFPALSHPGLRMNDKTHFEALELFQTAFIISLICTFLNNWSEKMWVALPHLHVSAKLWVSLFWNGFLLPSLLPYLELRIIIIIFLSRDVRVGFTIWQLEVRCFKALFGTTVVKNKLCVI